MGRRLLAVALVLASATGALALTQSPASKSPASNPLMPLGTNGHVVFAVRNTETTSITITGWTSSSGISVPAIGKPGSVNDGPCTDLDTPIGLDNSTGPWTLGPGEVHQFQVKPKVSLTAGDHQCVFASMGTATTQATVT